MLQFHAHDNHLEEQHFKNAFLFPLFLDRIACRTESVHSSQRDVDNENPLIVHPNWYFSAARVDWCDLNVFQSVNGVEMTSNNPAVFLLMVNGQIEAADVSKHWFLGDLFNAVNCVQSLLLKWVNLITYMSYFVWSSRNMTIFTASIVLFMDTTGRPHQWVKSTWFTNQYKLYISIINDHYLVALPIWETWYIGYTLLYSHIFHSCNLCIFPTIWRVWKRGFLK